MRSRGERGSKCRQSLLLVVILLGAMSARASIAQEAGSGPGANTEPVDTNIVVQANRAAKKSYMPSGTRQLTTTAAPAGSKGTIPARVATPPSRPNLVRSGVPPTSVSRATVTGTGMTRVGAGPSAVGGVAKSGGAIGGSSFRR